MSTAPKRAFRLTLRLEADDRAELADALRSFADQVDREEVTTGVSGGPSSGSIYELLHDPAMTHERYFADLNEYLSGKMAGDAP